MPAARPRLLYTLAPAARPAQPIPLGGNWASACCIIVAAPLLIFARSPGAQEAGTIYRQKMAPPPKRVKRKPRKPLSSIASRLLPIGDTSTDKVSLAPPPPPPPATPSIQRDRLIIRQHRHRPSSPDEDDDDDDDDGNGDDAIDSDQHMSLQIHGHRSRFVRRPVFSPFSDTDVREMLAVSEATILASLERHFDLARDLARAGLDKKKPDKKKKKQQQQQQQQQQQNKTKRRSAPRRTTTIAAPRQTWGSCLDSTAAIAGYDFGQTPPEASTLFEYFQPPRQQQQQMTPSGPVGGIIQPTSGVVGCHTIQSNSGVVGRSNLQPNSGVVGCHTIQPTPAQASASSQVLQGGDYTQFDPSIFATGDC